MYMQRLSNAILIATFATTTFSAAAAPLSRDESMIPEAPFMTPDGRIGHPFVQTGNANPYVTDDFWVRHWSLSNWGGQVAGDSTHNILAVQAYITLPSTVTCNSTSDLYAPWVGLNGYGSSTVQQTGIAISCASGSPTYQGWYEMYPANPVYISTTTYPLHPGEVIIAWVTNTNGSYSINLQDNGVNDTGKIWLFHTTQSGPTTAASGEAVVESPPNKYPNFGSELFSVMGGNSTPGPTHSLFGTAAGTPTITNLTAGYGTTTEVTASGISYGSFSSPLYTDTYVHE